MNEHFVILSMNPGYDRWLFVHKESPFPTVVRADSVLKLISGKGLNLARVFNNLGFTNYCALNLIGGEIGDILNSHASKEGLITQPCFVEDETRINIGVIRTYNKTLTTYNEPGPIVQETEVNQYIAQAKELLLREKNSCLVFSGSAPRGFGASHVLTLVKWANKQNIPVCVDIGGEWLEAVVAYPLHLLKINREEFFHAFHIDVKEKEKIRDFKNAHKITTLVITDGERGSYAWGEENEFFHCTVQNIEDSVGFTVGCGDSFLAGYLIEMANGSNLKEKLLIGNACGIANTRRYGPAVFSKEDFELSKQKVLFT